jgi:hypothetical protein
MRRPTGKPKAEEESDETLRLRSFLIGQTIEATKEIAVDYENPMADSDHDMGYDASPSDDLSAEAPDELV